MKPFKTKEELAKAPNTGQAYYGFIKTGKKKYALSIIQPGAGYGPIMTIQVPPDEAYKFFFDLYMQLKCTFEDVPDFQ